MLDYGSKCSKHLRCIIKAFCRRKAAIDHCTNVADIRCNFAHDLHCTDDVFFFRFWSIARRARPTSRGSSVLPACLLRGARQKLGWPCTVSVARTLSGLSCPTELPHAGNQR